MRSQKFVAYTATCLAVLGGLALAKPATVHAADTTNNGAADTTATAKKFTSTNVSNDTKTSLSNLNDLGNKAIDAYSKQKDAESDAASKKAAYDAVSANDKATYAEKQAAANALDAANKAKDAATASATAAANDFSNAEKPVYWGQNDNEGLRKEKKDLDAANKAVNDAVALKDRHNASYQKALKNKFGKAEKDLDASTKAKLDAFTSYKAAPNDKQAEAAMKAAGTILDADAANVKNNTVTYDQLGKIFFDTVKDPAAVKKAQDAADKLNDKYVKDLGVYRIQTYVDAKKKDMDAQAELKSATAAVNANPLDTTAQNNFKAAQEKVKGTPAQGDTPAKLGTEAKLAAAEDALKNDVQGVINTTTPSKPTDTNPVVPPVTPSDNNNSNTNNNTQAQTLYVSYSEHPTWKVATLNDNGVYTDNYVDQNTAITVMQSKTVNGELLYKIADNQWIPAKYTAKQASANAEEAASGVATLNEVPGHPTWKINMLDASGHYTNVYLNPNTAWKVFGKKTINGEVCYRLGSQSQWVPAKYLSLN